MDALDLDRLERVRRYAATPATERDDEWVREFEGAFWPSLVVAPDTQIVYGSQDSRPYRVVLSYEASNVNASPNFGARVTSSASLVDELIEGGQGLILGAPNGGNTCVFTLGEILSYRLYGRAFTRPLPRLEAVGIVKAGATIRLAPPSKATFPHWVRINVRRHLTSVLSLEQPQAVWVEFPQGQSGLAFDLGAQGGVEPAKRREAFDGLRWLIPARMSYFAMDQLESVPEMRPF